MRKTLRFLLLSFLVMICGVSFAQTTVTFDVAVDKSASADAGEVSITKDGVTIATTQGIFGNGSQYRIYKSQTFTVTSTEGNIQKIEFTCTASGTAKYGPGCFTDPTAGTYTYDDKVGTWVGDAASVSLTASLNQVRATKIVVTIGSANPDAVAAPVITGQTEFDTTTEVTITAGEGTSVYYTLDGTEPSASSTAYTAPFTIDKSCTVSAIAMKGNNKSDVVKKEFVKVELEEVTIASLNTLTVDKSNLLLRLNNAKVVYVDGNTLHLREGDKALMFFNSPIKMAQNAVVSGTVKVDYDNYYGIHEVKGNAMTNADNLTITESNEEAKPVVTTIADVLGLKHIADLVEFQNVQIVADGTKYYAVFGEDKIQLYGGIAVKDFAGDGKAYNVAGVFNNIYKNVAQIEPTAVTPYEATGINSVESNINNSNAIYNLAGQRLQKLQKGLNIVGGKKVVVK